jgi:hypothetical protein
MARPYPIPKKKAFVKKAIVPPERPFAFSMFDFTDDRLQSFTRIASRPNDCVVNTMQLIGQITEREAALLRIVLTTESLSITKITTIFTLLQPHKFRFIDVDSSKFEEVLNMLPKQKALFAGYESVIEDKTFKHVFTIAKTIDGKLVLIDSQLPTQMCDLSKPECLLNISNRDKYMLLQNTKDKITVEEQNRIVSYSDMDESYD